MITKNIVFGIIAGSVIVSAAFVIFFHSPQTGGPIEPVGAVMPRLPVPSPRNTAVVSVPAMEKAVLQGLREEKDSEIGMRDVFVDENIIRPLVRDADASARKNSSFLTDGIFGGGGSASLLNSFGASGGSASLGNKIAELQALLQSVNNASSSTSSIIAGSGLDGLSALLLNTPGSTGIGGIYKDSIPTLAPLLQSASNRGRINESQREELMFVLEELLPRLLNAPR